MKCNVKGLFRVAVFGAVVLAVLLFFRNGLFLLQDSRKEEGRLQLEAAVRRAAVACYAAEGVYPPSLEYVREHYGLQYDSEGYTVIYEVFGANLMPDITVVKRGS